MNTHRIHRVARLSGLSKDVIRVWERRFGLIKPMRSANRYREYTDEDVALLRFLKEELDRGNSIGTLSLEGREALLHRMRAHTAPTLSTLTPHSNLIDELTAALNPLDKARFEKKLNGAVAVIPFEEALQRILLPLQQHIGMLWHEGRITVAIEHYVTGLVQQKLLSALNHLPMNERGIKVVVACPAGEFHEIGAQAAAYTCGASGCHVYYLGANLPVSELMTFCEDIQPDLVLLSITEIPSDTVARQLVQDLDPLAKRWPLAVGGHGARHMATQFPNARMALFDDLSALRDHVSALLARAAVHSRG